MAVFEGVDPFFLEWRLLTDGPSSEITGTAPASIVIGGYYGVTYHFTIAEDQIRLIRDNLLPILYIDIELGQLHTYRLELYGETLYRWYIDGLVADEGTPEGAFPNSEYDEIVFRAKSWYLESTTQWDYIRYGRLPVDGSGDFDSDQDLDLADFYYVEECLQGPDTNAGPGCRFADFDQDEDVDLWDLARFQAGFDGGE